MNLQLVTQTSSLPAIFPVAPSGATAELSRLPTFEYTQAASEKSTIADAIVILICAAIAFQKQYAMRNLQGQQIPVRAVHPLLQFAGTWKGDDFEACLSEVIDTRGKTNF